METSVDIDDTMPEEWTSQASPPPISDQPPQQDQSVTSKQRRPYRLRKLRESCNNCALSKVKCTKEQPICSRCEEREMECQYSPSRRIGKRRGPSSQQHTSTPDIVQTTVPPKEVFNRNGFNSPMIIDPELAFDDTDGGEFLSAFSRGRHTQFVDKGGIPLSGNCNAMLHNTIPTKTLNPFMLSETSTNSTSWGLDFEYEDPMLMGTSSAFPYDEDLLSPHMPAGHYPRVPGYPDELYRQTRASGKFVATSTDDYFSGFEAGAKQGSENCMERAMAILRTLKGSSSRCTSVIPSPLPTPSSLTPTTFPLNRSSHRLNISSAHSSSSSCSSIHAAHTINEVLTVNKEAITAACDIIDCACSIDIQIAFVLTSIASQVMSRYVSAASTRYDDMMMGVDDSGSENQTKMQAQLVLGELHLVLRLIESLASRFKTIQNGDDTVSQVMGAEVGASSCPNNNTVFENESDDDEQQRRRAEQKVYQRPDSTSMFAELEKFLRDQLRLIVKEATATLRMS